MKIDVVNLTKKFKKEIVLSDVNLHFDGGHIYGLYGRNGSGKSVFLKLLCGFYLPTNGQILYDDVDINGKNEFPKSLRALIEKPSFFPELTGYENLKLLADIQKKINKERIDEVFEIVNLTEEKNKKYSKYSLGMKQKLGIAQAIMEDVDVIILDEPFNGIEQKTVDKLIEYFKNISKMGKLIIVSTHILDDLNRLADSIYYFDNGYITSSQK